MKLIPRRKQQTPMDKALAVASKGVRALVAIRVARTSARAAKRAPLVAVGAAAGLFAVRKMRGGRPDEQTPVT